MNILILTPDAVGSTLLQRLLTVYMQFHNFGKPVINLHEVTNGIDQYFNEHVNQLVLGQSDHGYSQTLVEIQNLLESVDHFKIARLAQYHIAQRGDDLDSQIPFYNYLNKNFFIISSLRRSIFEQAISWCITKIVKRLNVYHPIDKINAFEQFYQTPINIDTQSFINSLETYAKYINWCDTFFDVKEKFYYEDVPDIEQFILGLPVFRQHNKIGFEDKYQINFKDFNRCHFYTSDVVNLTKQLGSSQDTDFLKIFFDQSVSTDYNQISDPSWPAVSTVEEFEQLPTKIKEECINLHSMQSYQNFVKHKNAGSMIPQYQANFIQEHQTGYRSVMQHVNQLTQQGILPGSIPIKKQTLSDKRAMIKNWSELIDTYNHWIEGRPELGTILDQDGINQQAETESRMWRNDSLAIQSDVFKSK